MGAPAPPSPSTGQAAGQQVASGQQQYNTNAGESSQAGSMVNQNNAYGGLNYTQTGTGPNGTPIYTANTSLSTPEQGLLNTYQGTQGTAGNQAGSLLAGANYGASSPSQTIGNMASGLEGQQMASYQAGNQPMQQTAVFQLDTQLRNQGLQPGEPGYDNAMRGLTNSQTLANDTANANFASTAFNQANTMYTEPLSMATTLGQFGAPQTPNSSFVNAPGLNIQPANLIGATSTENQAVQDQYNAQMQQYSGMMNGLFGIGSDALGVMTGGMSMPFTSAMGSGGIGLGSGSGTGGLY